MEVAGFDSYFFKTFLFFFLFFRCFVLFACFFFFVLAHPLFFSPFTVVRPTQIFGIFKRKKSNDVVTAFFT